MHAASCSSRSTATVSKNVFDDFSAPTPCRNARIVVEDRVLYVNAGWLAELSPLFLSMFFGDKAASMELHMAADVSYDQMLELMRVVFYCPTRKPITISNIAAVMKMATKFEMRPVVERCEDIIARKVNTLDQSRLFQVACVISQCDRYSHTMTLLVDKLSSMTDQELSTLQFSQVPGDVVADVYAAKMKRQELKRKKRKWCCFF